MEPIQDDRPRTISDDATLVEWACGASSPSPAAHEALIRILHRMAALEAERERLAKLLGGTEVEYRVQALQQERDRLRRIEQAAQTFVMADNTDAAYDALIAALES
jgi:hypothetical protein